MFSKFICGFSCPIHMCDERWADALCHSDAVMLKNENMCNQQGPLYTILTHTHTDAVSRSEETTKRSKDKTTERPNLKTKKKKNKPKNEWEENISKYKTRWEKRSEQHRIFLRGKIGVFAARRSACFFVTVNMCIVFEWFYWQDNSILKLTSENLVYISIQYS